MTLDDPVAAERSLIEGAQAEPKLFAVVYAHNVNAVFAHVLRRCGNRGTAEDITSDVFLRALRALPRFEWQGVPYRAYLRRIADNLLNDHFIRTAREGALPIPAESAVEQPTTTDDDLLAFIGHLPEDQRRVLAMRFAEDKSIAQVAAEMGRTEGAVKQLQHRAMATLRTHLASEPALQGREQ